MRRFLQILGSCIVAAHGLFAAPLFVYVGTVPTKDGGIYRFSFDPADGSVSAPVLAMATNNPSWITADVGGRHLYTVDAHAGPVSAFLVNRTSGALVLINQQPTGGPDSSVAHLIAAASGRMLIVPDYKGAAISTYSIAGDGSIGQETGRIELRGPRGPVPKRQDHAFPHGVALSPDNRFAAVFDRGLDRVHVFRLDVPHAQLIPAGTPFAVVAPGSGPRHGLFSADGHFLYVVNELGNSVCGFAYDAKNGGLSLRQTIPTLSADFSGESVAAEIQLHPNGRFVYVSNRGPKTNSLAVFGRDPESGTLTAVQTVPCGGDTPRNFVLTPDGRWLLCANQESGSVVVFQVDPTTGRLTPTGRQVAITKPMCLLLLEASDPH